MAAIQIAQKTLAKDVPSQQMDLLKKLEGLGLLTETAEEIISREDMADTFKKAKPTKKKTSKTLEERVGVVEEHKCQCRIWKRLPGDMSYDNLQCTGKKLEGSQFCKRHSTDVEKNDGKWWLGVITEPRPEEPFGPPGTKNARVHKWNTDSEGNEVIHEKKKRTPKKTSEKKPKKEKESKKEKEDPVEETKEWSEEELMALLEQKKKEKYEEEQKEEEESTDNQQQGTGCFPTDDDETEDMSDTEEDIYENIEVDGVEYQLNKEDLTVIRCDDFSPVGVWNKETETIEFDENDE
jgi:hypothetical protein